MVAYSYKGRFVAPIRVGLGLPVLPEHFEIGGYHPAQIIRPKFQTIRGQGRRRHARPGEALQHYHGMRSPKCFKIGDARCTSADEINLFVKTGRIVIRHVGSTADFGKPSELDAFAVRDGLLRLGRHARVLARNTRRQAARAFLRRADPMGADAMKPNKAYRKFAQACLDAPAGSNLSVGVMWAETKGWRVAMQVHTSILHIGAETARGLAAIYDKTHRSPEWRGKSSGLEWVAPSLREMADEVDAKNSAGAVPPEMLDLIAPRGRA